MGASITPSPPPSPNRMHLHHHAASPLNVGTGKAGGLGDPPAFCVFLLALPPKTPSKGGRKQNTENYNSYHPQIFTFHGPISLISFIELSFLYDDICLFFGTFDLDRAGGRHFRFKAQGPHHNDTHDPPDDLPGPKRRESGK